MKISRLRVNHIKNPIGYDFDTLSFSWICESDISTKQKWSRVRIATDKNIKDVVSDSGRVKLDNLSYRPNKHWMKPKTRYYWRVTVCADKGDRAEADGFFESSKMDGKWNASWITPAWDDKDRHPYFHKSFSVNEKIKSARIYVSGLGLYELDINGKKVVNSYFAPYCNAYDRWIQYQTYDVTELIQKGENDFGALMGSGWAKGRFGFLDKMGDNYCERYALIAELEIQTQSGKTMLIKTDNSFEVLDSPIVADSIHDGEIFDANLKIDLKNGRRFSVREYDPQLGSLCANMSIPVKVKRRIKPKTLIRTPKGEWVLDVGENITGWVEFFADLKKGEKVTLSYGEIMQDGCFYNKNLRSAKAQYTYISDGMPAICAPHFTYFGFRYVKIEGVDADIKNFTVCAVYSDINQIGKIKTSNRLVNKLIDNAFRSQCDNFLDVPTDCPQRDERMGWTGDAQIFSSTALYNTDCVAFFAKYMRDLYEEQILNNGAVNNIVPMIIPKKRKPTPHLICDSGIAAWGDAACIIPWNTYLHTGDVSILERQFESMRDWVEWIHGEDIKSGEKNLWITDTLQLGDWLALDGPDPFKPQGGTDTGLIASAYYYFSTVLTAKAAKVLGKLYEYEKYTDLSGKIKQAFNKRFFKNGKIIVDTQTAYAIVLHFGLCEARNRAKLIKAFEKRMVADGMYLKTGFVGTPYLCPALSESGEHAIAEKLLLNTEFPSWLFEVKLGATTIWERWNSVGADGKISDTGMNSLNHYAYGSVVEWIYAYVCGIKPVSNAPGFKEVIFKPMPLKKIKKVRCTLDSAAGKYECGWEYKREYKYKLTVPFGCTARVELPDGRKLKVGGGDYEF